MKPEQRSNVVLGLRLEPEFVKSLKVYVAQLGRGWTVSKLAETVLRRELAKRQARA